MGTTLGMVPMVFEKFLIYFRFICKACTSTRIPGVKSPVKGLMYQCLNNVLLICSERIEDSNLCYFDHKFHYSEVLISKLNFWKCYLVVANRHSKQFYIKISYSNILFSLHIPVE